MSIQQLMDKDYLRKLVNDGYDLASRLRNAGFEEEAGDINSIVRSVESKVDNL